MGGPVGDLLTFDKNLLTGQYIRDATFHPIKMLQDAGVVDKDPAPPTDADGRAAQAKASDGSLIAPDLTDDQIRGAQAAALRRAQQGSGLASTFLTGPLGSPMVKPMPPLGGG